MLTPEITPQLAKALSQLYEAECKYRKLRNEASSLHIQSEAAFSQVVDRRLEVRQLTCIGSELAAKVYLDELAPEKESV